MPIISPEWPAAPVFYPGKDYTVVKYLDLTKFISMLQTRSLFFCRLDKLEDIFEGTTAKPNFQDRIKWHYQNNHQFDKPLSQEEILKSVQDRYEFERKLKSIICVNCWNKAETESAALWKIYSDFNKGILIKSSVSKLISALNDTEEKLELSEVRYIDYNKELMPDGNSNWPIIHKHMAYSYESEVRIIHQIQPTKGWEYDWSKEKVEEGRYLDADINSLIQEVIISPYAPNWFFEMVEDICSKYGLIKPINKSDLSNN